MVWTEREIKLFRGNGIIQSLTLFSLGLFLINMSSVPVAEVFGNTFDSIRDVHNYQKLFSDSAHSEWLSVSKWKEYLISSPFLCVLNILSTMNSQNNYLYNIGVFKGYVFQKFIQIIALFWGKNCHQFERQPIGFLRKAVIYTCFMYWPLELCDWSTFRLNFEFE